MHTRAHSAGGTSCYLHMRLLLQVEDVWHLLEMEIMEHCVINSLTNNFKQQEIIIIIIIIIIRY